MGENHGKTERERNSTMSMAITDGFSGEIGFLDFDPLSYWNGFHIQVMSLHLHFSEFYSVFYFPTSSFI